MSHFLKTRRKEGGTWPFGFGCGSFPGGCVGDCEEGRRGVAYSLKLGHVDVAAAAAATTADAGGGCGSGCVDAGYIDSVQWTSMSSGV